MTPTDETFEPTRPTAGAAVYHPRPDDPRVTLELPRGASWVTESAPAESVEDLADGRQRIVVPVSEPAWLERILLQVGPGGRGGGPAGVAGRRARRRAHGSAARYADAGPG